MNGFDELEKSDQLEVNKKLAQQRYTCIINL